MEPQQIGRLWAAGIAVLFALILTLVRIFALKDKKEIKEAEIITLKGTEKIIKKEKITLIEKLDWERKLCSVITILISTFIFGYGMQPWRLLDTLVIIGYVLTLGIGFLPLIAIIFLVLGRKFAPKKFDRTVIIYANEEGLEFIINTYETFVKGGIRYVKAEKLKDELNENWVAMLIDVKRDQPWNVLIDGLEYDAFFANDVRFTDNLIEIQTFLKYGGLITKELLESESEDEIKNKSILIAKLEEFATELVESQNKVIILEAEQLKMTLENAAKLVVLFLKQFEDMGGFSTEKMTKAKEDIEQIIANDYLKTEEK